ncbi:MAG: YicC/YloC family endoribonuclease [Bacteroidota bacterium]|nr:YicC/YloC family endoribonuclease [Bacteroidota bacterium]
MITSMTGYGKADIELSGYILTIEIRTLNSKSLDLSLKLHNYFRDKESEIRALIAQKLDRGKVEMLITSENTSSIPEFAINKELVKQYYKEIADLMVEIGEKDTSSILPSILKLPDVLVSGRDEITGHSWEAIKESILKALDGVVESRLKEGIILEKDIRERVHLILSYLDLVRPLEKNRSVVIREKLINEFRKMKEDERQSIVVDENRFEQELIYYLERLDITEEQVRLKKHCDYFIETLDEPVSQGKKLGFITQEMGREINTMGSKANDAAIQKIVVKMKDELEKIKEQLLNIL